MTNPTLGRLQKVDIHEIWKNDSSHFTPWLAEPDNIKLLGDTIGMELQVDSVEKEVGRFYADILCKETTSDRYVVIENQIDRTDHDHLGKTITYAAGLGATAVVWITRHFLDEHRAAFDWLNEISHSEVAFFGLEIEAWKIGGSAAAPKFNIVCRPNDWQLESSPASTMTEWQKTQLEFWLGLKESMEETSRVKCSKPQAANWMSHPLGRTGFWLSSVFSSADSETGGHRPGGELRVEMVIDHSDSKGLFASLRSQEREISGELLSRVPESLTWVCKEGVHMCRLYVRTAVDVYDRSKWSEYHEWLRERLEAFDSTFRPRVAVLEVSDAADGE